MAGVCEDKFGYCSGAVGHRALAIWHANGAHAPVRGHPALHTSSYVGNNGNPWKDLRYPDREDFDQEWNFLYFSYSYEARKARILAYFSHSDQVVTNVWDNSNHRWPLRGLKFRMGGCNRD